MQIVLASSSPSRKKILNTLGLSFMVIPSNIDEEEVKKTVKDIPQIVKTLALKKAEAVEKIVKKKKIKDYLIIGADSLAEIDGIYLDKPKNRNHARKMLFMSKGKSNRFYSGLAIIGSNGKRKTIVGESKVFFNNFTDKQLDDVIDSGIWKGRAGGYDIPDFRKRSPF